MKVLPPILRGLLSHDSLHFHSDVLIEVKANTKELYKRTPKSKQIVLITGPTGSGTDTIINNMPENKYVRWKTWTTRQEIRPDGIDELKYVRVDTPTFQSEVEKGNFIEYNPNYVSNAYGTHIREAQEAFADGRIPVLQIDPTGAENFNRIWINEEYPFGDASLFHFYIIPPTKNELKRRLFLREQDKKSAALRIEKAFSLLPYAKNAQYIVINRRDRIIEAVQAIDDRLDFFLKG